MMMTSPWGGQRGQARSNAQHAGENQADRTEYFIPPDNEKRSARSP